MITTLQPNEVFVFGSNATGFHGAGAAGFACRGESKNTWRNDRWFLEAITAPVGDPARVGKWAVFGVAKGFQEGREGKSYAIVTVTKPGARQSVSRREIYYQLVELWKFAREHPELKFLVTPIGEGYAGWSRAEMGEVWSYLRKTHGEQANVEFVGQESGVAMT